MKDRVALVKCGSYDNGELASALKKAVELTGKNDFEGKTILLKPNILSGEAPEKAVTTHPSFVRQCVSLFRELGAKEVLAGDSPGFQSTDAAGRKSGILDAVLEAGGTWVDFSDSVTVKNPAGKLVKSFNLASAIKKADIIVSLPKMKNHQLLYVTGAMKNLFGLVPGLQKSAFHMRFSDRENFAAMIVDLNIAAKPGFAIMDGITAMEGPGPGSGKPRHAGIILASSNLLALDIVSARLMGYDPTSLPVISEALSRKKWLENADSFDIAGENPESLVMHDFDRIKKVGDVTMFRERMPHFLYAAARRFVVPVPVINHEKCIECGYCVRICPAGALTLPTGPDSRVLVDYGKCISCYCCHEICPAKAISIKKMIFR